MATTDTPRPAHDLVTRSWAAAGIGVVLIVLGAIILDANTDPFAPAASVAVAIGAVLGALGVMTVQAAIVGFVFGSYDGVRRSARAQGAPRADGRLAPPEDRAAAWHPDPTDPSRLRWWDGGRWTETKPAEDPA